MEIEENSLGVTSVSQIIPLVRRALVFELAKFATFIAVLSFLMYWLNDSTRFFYLGPFFLVLAGLQLYVGRYIPISNRHDSLVSQYGDVYVREVLWAANELGIRKILKTRWFESYAEEFCKRRANS